MHNLITLLLPGLVPSWAFFKAIEPSPRIQWRLLDCSDGKATDWQDYRPAPEFISVPRMLGRLFWNPYRNEALYMVSLAERLTLDPTQHSVHSINARLAKEVSARLAVDPALFLQFQLVFVSRDGAGIVRDVTHISEPLAPASVTQ